MLDQMQPLWEMEVDKKQALKQRTSEVANNILYYNIMYIQLKLKSYDYKMKGLRKKDNTQLNGKIQLCKK